jgi:hypothetical protein
MKKQRDIFCGPLNKNHLSWRLKLLESLWSVPICVLALDQIVPHFQWIMVVKDALKWIGMYRVSHN